jgi:hypothetical protein
MRTLRKPSLTIGAGMMVAILRSATCEALDYQPFDWVPMPAGTSVVMGYYEFATRNEFNSTITGTTKANTNLDTDTAIARYIYYGQILGHSWDIDFVQPYIASNTGKINGERLGSMSGLGDFIFSPGFWFINDAQQRRYLSLATFTAAPTGDYDPHKVLNPGSNRWQNDLQADFTQGFSDKFWVDISGDWTYYSNNTRAGTGNQTLRQHATYEAYAWLSYDLSDLVQRVMPQASHAYLAVGYAGAFGGVQTLNGTNIGTKTSEQQIRATYMMFFSPQWQGLLSVSHDVAAYGQFKQNFGLTLRVARLF